MSGVFPVLHRQRTDEYFDIVDDVIEVLTIKTATLRNLVDVGRHYLRTGSFQNLEETIAEIEEHLTIKGSRGL